MQHGTLTDCATRAGLRRVSDFLNQAFAGAKEESPGEPVEVDLVVMPSLFPPV